MNPEVTEYFNKQILWKAEREFLRSLLLDCGLTEELKWKQPCYTFKNKNILILAAFKEYCSVSFFKGVLLADAHHLLVSPGENSQSVKLMKFTSLTEITKLQTTLKAYIFEALELEKLGAKVTLKPNNELTLVEELVEMLAANSQLKNAFESLTPGRQRGYNLFFSGAKQSSTRISRIEKYAKRILDGKGINDCFCGLSKKMPNCDGSHKYL